MTKRREFLRMMGAAGAVAALPVIAARKKTRSLYEVGCGKEFATIQGAVAQLAREQGSRPFETQKTIRVWPGVYGEAVKLPEYLSPTRENRLLIESAIRQGARLEIPRGEHGMTCTRKQHNEHTFARFVIDVGKCASYEMTI